MCVRKAAHGTGCVYLHHSTDEEIWVGGKGLRFCHWVVLVYTQRLYHSSNSCQSLAKVPPSGVSGC